MARPQGSIVAAAAILSVAVAAVFGDLRLVAIVAGAWSLGLLGAIFVRLIPSWRAAPSVSATTKVEKVPSDGPPDLRRLAGLAFGVRVVGALFFNLTGLNLSVAPDSVAYSQFGRLIARSWEDPSYSLEGVVGYSSQSLYQHLNAIVWYVLRGDSGLVMSMFNAALGVLAAWLVSRLAFSIYGAVAARRAFILAAFYPSLVLWTCINLRDSWSFALMIAALLSVQTLRERFSISRLITLFGCFALMPFVRGYLVPVIGLGILSSYLLVRVRRLPTAILSMAGLLVFLLVLANAFGVSLAFDLEDRLQTIERMRNGLAYGDSAFDTSMSLSTPGAALLYLPIGVLNFLFSPFPWRVSSWRQVIALPETILTYWIVYQAAREMWRGARERISEIAVPAFVAIAITCCYGLVEGNEGTAFRHRAHVLLIYFVFAGAAYARQRSQAGAAVASLSSAPSPALTVS